MGDERIRMKVRRGEWEFEVEGPRDYVEERIARAIAEMEGSPLSISHAADGGSTTAPARSRTRLKEFVSAKGPRNHLENAATIAAWAREGGVTDISGGDLDRYYKEAQLKRPSDSLHILQRAASEKGWFELAGEGKYRLTSSGEDYVTFDLPPKKG